MSQRVSWLGAPWWAWAIIVWVVSLVVTIIVSLLAPSNLWTLPTNREEKVAGELSRHACDKCALFNDQFYLAILRSDQCEAAHFVAKTACPTAKCPAPPVPPPPPCKTCPTCKATGSAASCAVAATVGYNPAADTCCNLASVPQNAPLCITGTILEPQNTWSNFGYILMGILVLFSSPSLLGFFVGVNFCLIGIFSGFYHATLQPWTQAFDVAWIYAMIFSVLFYGAECLYLRYRREETTDGSGFPFWLQLVLAIAPIVSGVLVGILKNAGHWDVDSTIAFIVLISILGVEMGFVLFDRWLISPFDDNPQYTPRYYLNLGHYLRYLPIFAPPRNWIAQSMETKQEWMGISERVKFGLLAAVCGGITFVLRLTDGCGHPLCSPHSIIQAHASWHVLGAVALFWVYDFLAQAAARRDDTIIKLGSFGS